MSDNDDEYADYEDVDYGFALSSFGLSLGDEDDNRSREGQGEEEVEECADKVFVPGLYMCVAATSNMFSMDDRRKLSITARASRTSKYVGDLKEGNVVRAVRTVDNNTSWTHR